MFPCCKKKKKSSKRREEVLERVDPELLPVLDSMPPLQLKSWMMPLVAISNFLGKHAPMKRSKDAKVTSIKNVGIYVEPTTTVDPALRGAAILWIHGGGRIMGHPKENLESVACRLVRRVGVPLLSVDYRLAPRHAFPAALDDCTMAWDWLSAQQGIDRIVVGGESAGGGLAAELCQKLHDQGNQQQPLAQVLVYPMLDDRTVLDETKTQQKYLSWNNEANRIAWEAYLGPNHATTDDLPEYAAAARRSDLSGLPPALVFGCELDLFREENWKYAERLRLAGVDARYEEIKGGFHGIFTRGTSEPPVVKLYDSIAGFMKKHLLPTSN